MEIVSREESNPEWAPHKKKTPKKRYVVRSPKGVLLVAPSADVLRQQMTLMGYRALPHRKGDPDTTFRWRRMK